MYTRQHFEAFYNQIDLDILEQYPHMRLGRGQVALEMMRMKATEVRLARSEQENGLTPSI